MRYTVRPISDRTWLGTQGSAPTRFEAKWSATLDLLEREIDMLRGRDVVLEVDVPEKDLRMDGTLRANASPASRAVAVAFESKHGPLLYRCDRFYTNWAHQGPEWQHNVRAIALTLEALRAVDRYGASASGEQYRGYKAIGTGPAMAMGTASHMTSDEAVSILASFTELPASQVRSADPRWVVRTARGRAHPDRHGGDRSFWDEVEQAAKVLGLLK